MKKNKNAVIISRPRLPGIGSLLALSNRKDRVLMFFLLFGGTKQYPHIFSAEVVGSLLEVSDDTVRRYRRSLETAGKLQKVQQLTPVGWVWAWIPPDDTPSVSVGPLASLNNSVGPGIIYCNPGEEGNARRLLSSKLPSMSGLYVASVRWWELLPGLVDWADSAVWTFWQGQGLRLVNMKKSLLIDIAEEQRLDQVLFFIGYKYQEDKRLNGFKPVSHVGWAVSVLKRLSYGEVKIRKEWSQFQAFLHRNTPYAETEGNLLENLLGPGTPPPTPPTINEDEDIDELFNQGE